MDRLMTASSCLVVLLGVAACATQPRTESMDAAPASAEAAASAETGTTADTTGIDRYCVRQTGTRIDVRDDRDDKTAAFRDGCIAAGGRVYTREDIESTGEVDLADALRKLDPAIQSPPR